MSLGGTGLRDWMIQRYSAIYLALYTLFIVGYVLQPHWTHADWQFLFSHHWMHIATLLALVSMALYAWIGIWIVVTDYVRPLFLRYLLLGLVFILLFSYFVWGIMILWG